MNSHDYDLYDLALGEDEVMQATDRLVMETKQILADLRASNANAWRQVGSTRAQIEQLRATKEKPELSA